MEDLGLAWPALVEPTCGLLNVHKELTRKWRDHYSARVNPSTSAALTIVDGTDERGYCKLPPLEEAVAVHLCPLSAMGLKALQANLSSSKQGLFSGWPGWLSASHGGGAPSISGQISLPHGRVRPEF